MENTVITVEEFKAARKVMRHCFSNNSTLDPKDKAIIGLWIQLNIVELEKNNPNKPL